MTKVQKYVNGLDGVVEPWFDPVVDTNWRDVEKNNEGRKNGEGETEQSTELVDNARVRTEIERLMNCTAIEVDGFKFATIRDFYEAYKAKRVTPLQVAESIISILSSSDTAKPIFISQIPNDLLMQAKASTERWKTNKMLSILDGIPVSVKDEVDVKGYKTTGGTTFFGKLVNEKVKVVDGFCVEKMRELGALVVGKTNMHEFGIDITNNNPHYGTPRNPYGLERYPGGSSGGSACAVASGLCPIGIGVDGGGSIRIPSSFCGLYGLKPTFSRVSVHPTAGVASTVSHAGPMCANAYDLAIAYTVMAQRDPSGRYALIQPPHMLTDFYKTNSLSDVTIGIFRDWYNDCSDQVRKECDKVLEYYQSLGARIIGISIPDIEIARTAHAVTILAEMRSWFDTDEKSKFIKELSCPSRLAVMITKHATGSDYIQCQIIRSQLINYLKDEIFSQCDVIVTPSTPCPAPAIHPSELPYGVTNSNLTFEVMRFMHLANFSGIPAISIPIGYTRSDHLPISIQFMSSWWNESILLRLAHVNQIRMDGKSKGVGESGLEEVKVNETSRWRKPVFWENVLQRV
ncbi:amidase signature domain-containing protein [Paraphysoderma sedebokerense]|nr:amidase signature domain-containing protein [Paraphysoderma sedebokerense]